MNRACYPHGGKSPCILNVGVRRCWVSRLHSDPYLESFRHVGEGISVVRGAEIPCCRLVTCNSSGHPARCKWTNRTYSRAQRVGRARAECLKDVRATGHHEMRVQYLTRRMHWRLPTARVPSAESLPFVGAFAELRKATISFAMSVRPSSLVYILPLQWHFEVTESLNIDDLNLKSA